MRGEGDQTVIHKHISGVDVIKMDWLAFYGICFYFGYIEIGDIVEINILLLTGNKQKYGKKSVEKATYIHNI